MLHGSDEAGVEAVVDLPQDIEGRVPDFALIDQNPSSSTFGLAVSPRDYVGQVSAWYFGHAT